MRNLFTFLALLFLPAFASAQATWELGLAGHATNYLGDLVKENSVPLQNTGLGGGLFLRLNFNDYFALRLNGNYLQLKGDDAAFGTRKSRGYTFKTDLFEGSLQLELTPISALNKAGNRRGIRPYFFGGVGYATYDPKPFFNELAPENIPKAQKIAEDKRDVEKNVVVFPLGAGFKFPLGEKATLG
ncbi:MAG: DUF6089 family protein, partial [Saprospiraceae bacterium]